MNNSVNSQLSFIELYESQDKFILVGYQVDGRSCRVASIERTNIEDLKLFEYPDLFDISSCKVLLEDLSIQYSIGGGLKLIARARGILGCVKLLAGYYLILISKNKLIGKICGHRIFQIADTVRVYIPNDKAMGNYKFNPNMEDRYNFLMFNFVDMGNFFYYSYTYNIQCKLQTNICESQTCDTFGNQFVWNEYISRDLREVLSDKWIVPVIHGFLEQKQLFVLGKELVITLIGRRSRLYAGTRYLKRGINGQGHAANHVEVEQIVQIGAQGQQTQLDISSFVSIRGSIPLFWNQSKPSIIVPDIHLQKIDPMYSTTAKHFKDLTQWYGRPIIVVNLTRCENKKETNIRNEYTSAINHLNKVQESHNQIIYFAYDFNSYQKELKEVKALSVLFKACLKLNGTFSYNKELKGKNYKCILQHGCVRLNCIDSLDRTNVAQFILGLHALGAQLQQLHVILQDYIEPDSSIAMELMDIYINLGDALALQYGGSHAHQEVLLQKKGQWNLGAQFNDTYINIQRYMQNSKDANKQNAINLFLGNFIPRQRSPHIWELDDEYSMHKGGNNTSTQNPSLEQRSQSSNNIFIQSRDSSQANILQDQFQESPQNQQTPLSQLRAPLSSEQPQTSNQQDSQTKQGLPFVKQNTLTEPISPYPHTPQSGAKIGSLPYSGAKSEILPQSGAKSEILAQKPLESPFFMQYMGNQIDFYWLHPGQGLEEFIQQVIQKMQENVLEFQKDGYDRSTELRPKVDERGVPQVLFNEKMWVDYDIGDTELWQQDETFFSSLTLGQANIYCQVHYRTYKEQNSLQFLLLHFQQRQLIKEVSFYDKKHKQRSRVWNTLSDVFDQVFQERKDRAYSKIQSEKRYTTQFNQVYGQKLSWQALWNQVGQSFTTKNKEPSVSDATGGQEEKTQNMVGLISNPTEQLKTGINTSFRMIQNGLKSFNIKDSNLERRTSRTAINNNDNNLKDTNRKVDNMNYNNMKDGYKKDSNKNDNNIKGSNSQGDDIKYDNSTKDNHRKELITDGVVDGENVQLNKGLNLFKDSSLQRQNLLNIYRKEFDPSYNGQSSNVSAGRVSNSPKSTMQQTPREDRFNPSVSHRLNDSKQYQPKEQQGVSDQTSQEQKDIEKMLQNSDISMADYQLLEPCLRTNIDEDAKEGKLQSFDFPDSAHKVNINRQKARPNHAKLWQPNFQDDQPQKAEGQLQGNVQGQEKQRDLDKNQREIDENQRNLDEKQVENLQEKQQDLTKYQRFPTEKQREPTEKTRDITDKEREVNEKRDPVEKYQILNDSVESTYVDQEYLDRRQNASKQQTLWQHYQQVKPHQGPPVIDQDDSIKDITNIQTRQKSSNKNTDVSKPQYHKTNSREYIDFQKYLGSGPSDKFYSNYFQKNYSQTQPWTQANDCNNNHNNHNNNCINNSSSNNNYYNNKSNLSSQQIQDLEIKEVAKKREDDNFGLGKWSQYGQMEMQEGTQQLGNVQRQAQKEDKIDHQEKAFTQSNDNSQNVDQQIKLQLQIYSKEALELVKQQYLRIYQDQIQMPGFNFREPTDQQAIPQRQFNIST